MLYDGAVDDLVLGTKFGCVMKCALRQHFKSCLMDQILQSSILKFTGLNLLTSSFFLHLQSIEIE